MSDHYVLSAVDSNYTHVTRAIINYFPIIICLLELFILELRIGTSHTGWSGVQRLISFYVKIANRQTGRQTNAGLERNLAEVMTKHELLLRGRKLTLGGGRFSCNCGFLG